MIDANAAAFRIRPILASIKTTAIPVEGGRPGLEGHAAAPFITISRQSGAGAWSLAQRLVECLNTLDPGELAWTCWDRELVEKVAADHHIAKALVESLEESRHTWFTDFLASLSFTDKTEWADEAKVYRRVAATIRALGQVGRVVIVGRGGVFITRDMPGGIHIRLIAPFDHRVQHMMDLENLSHEAAVAYVREHDRNREAFYKRYWPDRSLGEETFTATFNTSQLTEDQLVACVVTMATQPKAAAAARAQAVQPALPT